MLRRGEPTLWRTAVQGRNVRINVTLPRQREKARGLLGWRYQDMDFYAEIGESACRPWITRNELRESRGFAYRPERLVVQFVARGDDVEVPCRGSDTYPPKA